MCVADRKALEYMIRVAQREQEREPNATYREWWSGYEEAARDILRSFEAQGQEEPQST